MTSLILDHALRIRLKAETHRAGDAEGRTDAEEAAKKALEKDNFIGRINNLITSDLDNIVNGRDFLFLSQTKFTSIRTQIHEIFFFVQ